MISSSGPYAEAFEPGVINAFRDFLVIAVGFSGYRGYRIEGAVVDKTNGRDRLSAILAAARAQLGVDGMKAATVAKGDTTS